MADLPKVGLDAVIENLAKFQKGAISIEDAYDNINAAADDVGKSTAGASGAMTAMGGAAATVASGGMALLVGAIAAVAATATAAIASIGLLAKASFNLASDVEASQKNIQSQLGVTEEEAEKLGNIAKEVWADNFAGSIGEASEAVIEIRKQIKGLSDNELKAATKNAFRLKDAFGIDITESTNAANVLMEKFGLTQQEAFNLITSGFQKGLNSSDDFLDSITEYSGLFAGAGGDAGQFFSLLETGLQGGVLGTDKAADAFKEFSIRFLEGDKEVLQSIEDLTGDGWQMFIDEIAAGDTTVANTFGLFTKLLSEIEDPIERNRIGVGLFGTQFEDLGADAVAGIDIAKTSLEDLGGATETLNAQYNSLPQAFEGVKRQLLVAIQPVGDAILEVANEVMPLFLDAVEQAKPFIEEFAKNLGTFLLKAAKDFSKWMTKTGIPALKELWKFIDKKVIPIIENLWKLFKQSKKQGKEVQKTFNTIIKSVEPLVKKILPELIEIWDIIKKWTEKNWPLIKKTIVTVMDAIKKRIDTVIKFISKIWDKWGDEIMATADFIFNTVFKIVKLQIKNVLDILTVTMKIITGDWKGAWDDIKNIIDRSWKVIVSIITDGIKNGKAIIEKVTKEIISFSKSKWNELKSTITNILNDLKNTISGIWNNIKTIVETIVTNMITSIVSKISGSVTTIRNALFNALSSAISSVASSVSSISALGSIASAIATTIKNKIAGLWGTIRTGIFNAISSAASAINIIGSTLTNLQKVASKIIVTIKDRIAGLWGSLRTGITTAISTAASKLSTLASSVLSGLKGIGTAIIQGIISGINDAKNELKNMLSGVMDLIPGWLKDFIQSGSPAKITMPIGADLMGGIQVGFADQIPNLMKTLGSVTAPVMASAPSLGASSNTITTNNINLGGNNISSNMDASVFEARVLQVIRNNL